MEDFRYAKYKAPTYYGSALVDDQITAIQELDRRHIQNQQLAAELESSVASLNLNEAESEYKGRLLSDIQNTISSAVDSGDYSKAGDAIRATARRMASDQGLQGRVRYQQEYDAAKNKVMQDPNLTVEDKQMWLDRNQYAYQDIKDAAGNVVGGSRYVEGQVAKAIDYNQVVTDASKLTAERSGKDRYGNTFKAKSANDIANVAVDRMMNDPQMRSRLDQEYAYNEKLHSEGKPSAIVNESGLIISKEQYAKNMIMSGATAASYNNQYLADPLDRELKLMQYENARADKLARQQKAKATADAKANKDKTLMAGVVVGMQPNKQMTYHTAASNFNRAVNGINNTASAYGIIPSKDYNSTYSATKKKILEDTSISDSVRSSRLSQLENDRLNARNGEHIKEQIRANIPADAKDIMDVQDAIDSGNLDSIPDNNKYKKYIVDLNNDAFTARKELGKPVKQLEEIGLTIGKSVSNKQKLIDDLKARFNDDLDVRTDRDGNTVVVVTRDQGNNNIGAISEVFSNPEFAGIRHTEITATDGNTVTTRFTNKDSSIKVKADKYNKTYNNAIEAFENSQPQILTPLEVTTTNQLSAAGVVDEKEINDHYQTIVANADWSNIGVSILKDKDGQKIATAENDSANKTELKRIFDNADKVTYAIGDNPNELYVNITTSDKYKDDDKIVKTNKGGVQLMLDISSSVKNDPMINNLYNSDLMQTRRLFNTFTTTNQASITTDIPFGDTNTEVVIKNDNGKLYINNGYKDIQIDRNDAETVYNASKAYNTLLMNAKHLPEETFANAAAGVINSLLIMYPDPKDRTVKAKELANNLRTAYGSPR